MKITKYTAKEVKARRKKVTKLYTSWEDTYYEVPEIAKMLNFPYHVIVSDIKALGLERPTKVELLRQQAVKLLQSNPYLKAAEIARLTGLSQPYASNVKKSLGIIEESPAERFERHLPMIKDMLVYGFSGNEIVKMLGISTMSMAKSRKVLGMETTSSPKVQANSYVANKPDDIIKERKLSKEELALWDLALFGSKRNEKSKAN